MNPAKKGKLMARDNQSLRRRAAVAVLSDVLDENTLLQELWEIQESLRGDSVSEIIACVDAVARRQMLDASTCKRLYAEFFKALRLPEASLPLDPLPAMQSVRVQPAAPLAPMRMATVPPTAIYRPVPPVAPPVMNGMPAPAMPAAAVHESAPILTQTVPLAAGPLAAEPPLVFSAMMRALIDELQRFHRDAIEEIRHDAMRALAASPAPAALREQFGRAWERAATHDWKLQGHAEDLASLTGVVHRALDMAFGRAGADQILQRALDAAGQLPAARSFSPMRLMSAL
jgi:hypothetical protein